MKVIISFLWLFGCAVNFLFSQNIAQDTILANECFLRAAHDESLPDSQRIDLLSKAIGQYEKYQLVDKMVESKSLMAYLDNNNAPELAAAAFRLAEVTSDSEPHQTLLYAYMALQKHYSLADMLKSIGYGEKVLEVVQKPSDDYYSIAFLLIGDYCYSRRMDDAQKLLEDLEQLKSETELEANPGLAVQIYRAHLQVELSQENFESAIVYGKKCIAENEQFPVYENETLGPIYVEVGNCYSKSGRLEDALDWMKKGLAVAGLQPNDPVVGSYYANMALACNENDSERAAIKYNEKAIELFLKDEVNYGSNLMIVLYNTAKYYYSLGELNNALKYIEKSYQYGSNYVLFVLHGNILSRLGNHWEALQYIQKALIMLCPDFEAQDISQTPDRYASYLNTYWATNALRNKATILAELGKDEHSEKYLKQSIEVSELTTQIQYDFLSELKGFEVSRMRYNQDIYLTLQVQARASQALYEMTGQEKYLDRYFEATERCKGMTLLQILTPSSLPEAVVAKEEKLLHTLRMLQQKTETAGADSLVFFQDKLFDAMQRYQAFVAQLRQDFPKRTNAFYNVEYAVISDIQDLLEEDECYIDYSYDKSNLHILSISKESVELVKLDIDDQFPKALMAMQKLLKDPLLMQNAKKTAFIRTSRQLYEYLILPVAHLLKNKSRIIIAPEKKLFYLPFEVLLQTDEIKGFEDLNYLVKKYEISYQYSATTFRQLQQQPVIGNNSFLAFAPVFQNGAGGKLSARDRGIWSDSLLRSLEGDHFRPLPNSRVEVSSIAELMSKYGQSNILMEEKALKKNLVTALTSQPWQFVHIATHGMVNFNNPVLSALACYEKEPSDEQLLYSNEIQLLDIQADVVVLSSCESGIGRLIEGEGLLALSRSFLYAGAKNVLFSLWKVNDRHTSTLMINFYKFYAEGTSYPEALRKAKLKMLKNPITANPRFWGAFVLIGK